jgi:hypothetical protein
MCGTLATHFNPTPHTTHPTPSITNLNTFRISLYHKNFFSLICLVISIGYTAFFTLSKQRFSRLDTHWDTYTHTTDIYCHDLLLYVVVASSAGFACCALTPGADDTNIESLAFFGDKHNTIESKKA